MNNILFAMLRCKQEWTCSCMSTATLIIKTVTSCIKGVFKGGVQGVQTPPRNFQIFFSKVKEKR